MEQRQETTGRLLEVSLELFVRKGYAGTTARDIAERAHVSPGLMFHYFPSKQAILEEHAKAVAQGIELVVQLLVTGTEPLETLTTIAQMNLESFKESYSKNLFLLANQILLLESIPAAVKEMVSATKTLEASVPLIIAGQHRSEIKPGDPLALAVAFWGALQGIAEVLVSYPTAPIPRAEDVVDLLRA
ncbi:MAG TPA: helix-turn-helix domain-containing protein [Blastocatellia bacterium]|nr:helix-turn-helix domain-containing protein [Blastocatellia bacterium]